MVLFHDFAFFFSFLKSKTILCLLYFSKTIYFINKSVSSKKSCTNSIMEKYIKIYY
jgi:hypothetical protein